MTSSPLPPAGSAPGRVVTHPATADWRLGQLAKLIAVDAMAIWLSLTVAAWARFDALRAPGLLQPAQAGRDYAILVAVVAGGWLIALSARGAYAPRFWGAGPEEYKRVVKASLTLFGALAVAAYAARLPLPRGFVAIALPLGSLLLLVGRSALRRRLVARRARGEACSRVVAVGDARAVAALQRHLHNEPNAGFTVVAFAGVDDDIRRAVRGARADTVAITNSRLMTPSRLREVAWSLEGSGVGLIVEPSLTDVAGPRITVAPVGGLALLHVDEPEFRGWRRLVKHSLDRILAGLGLLVLSLPLAVVHLAVRRTSPGPALFRQRRTGEHGRVFSVYKFRTMYVDAEQRRAALQADNETDGRLFKIKQDPRVTPVGRFLRRTSIDELPQLLNVLRGEMSLVGPRPLPVEDGDFVGHERRRLLVRPGITGLWQVSGRSDLSWEDSVRLDLYYVENWSITLDAVILARTAAVVTRGSGAY